MGQIKFQGIAAMNSENGLIKMIWLTEERLIFVHFMIIETAMSKVIFC